MNDSRPMRVVQPVGDLDAVFESFAERKRSLGKPLGKRFPIDVLHHEVVDTVLLADVEQSTDVRVVQLRDRFGLTPEALFSFEIPGKMLGKDFDRDGALETRVLGSIDLPHPPAPIGARIS